MIKTVQNPFSQDDIKTKMTDFAGIYPRDNSLGAINTVRGIYHEDAIFTFNIFEKNTKASLNNLPIDKYTQYGGYDKRFNIFGYHMHIQNTKNVDVCVVTFPTYESYKTFESIYNSLFGF